MNNQLLEEITSEYLQEKRDHFKVGDGVKVHVKVRDCLLYTSPSPRDAHESRMPSSA